MIILQFVYKDLCPRRRLGGHSLNTDRISGVYPFSVCESRLDQPLTLYHFNSHVYRVVLYEKLFRKSKMDSTENPQNDSSEELTALEVLLAKWEPAEVKIDSIEKRVTFERFGTKSHYLVNSGIL